MMLRIVVGAQDLARSRFAVSPLFELDSLLRLLSGVSSRRLPAAWMGRLRPAYERLRRETDLDAVLALQSHRRGAAFVAPPPAGLGQSVADDLDTMRRTELATARHEITECLAARPTADRDILRVLQSRQVVRLLGDALEQAWRELLATDWPQLRAVLERDVVHRAGELGRSGWEVALRGLSPQLRWRDGAVEVLRHADDTQQLAGQGLLLVPSVLVWPGIAVFLEDPWPRALIYPARGSAAL